MHPPSLHGVALMVALMWTALLGSLMLITPALLLLPLPFESTRRAYREVGSTIEIFPQSVFTRRFSQGMFPGCRQFTRT